MLPIILIIYSPMKNNNEKQLGHKPAKARTLGYLHGRSWKGMKGHSIFHKIKIR